MTNIYYKLFSIVLLSATLTDKKVFAEPLPAEEADVFDNISESLSSVIDMLKTLVEAVSNISLSLGSIAASVQQISAGILQMAGSLSIIAYFFAILTCFICLYITVKIIVIIAPLVKFTVLFIYTKVKSLFLHIFGKKKEKDDISKKQELPADTTNENKIDTVNTENMVNAVNTENKLNNDDVRKEK